jgi:beta-xylosidase
MYETNILVTMMSTKVLHDFMQPTHITKTYFNVNWCTGNQNRYNTNTYVYGHIAEPDL